jgi:hypothetical protein
MKDPPRDPNWENTQMHSHQQTLLAKLGFGDPDRKDRRHDLASQYLSQGEAARRLGEMFNPSAVRDSSRHDEEKSYRGGRSYDRSQTEAATSSCLADEVLGRLEVPIGKGEGQYRTTIGFLDVLMFCKTKEVESGRSRMRTQRESMFRSSPDWVAWKEAGCPAINGEPTLDDRHGDWGDWKSFSHERFEPATAVAVEVKIAPVGIGDILRQINLYREYERCLHFPSPTPRSIAWVLATPYALTPNDKAVLTAEKITHVRLGEGFEAFCRDADRPAEAGEESLEI